MSKNRIKKTIVCLLAVSCIISLVPLRNKAAYAEDAVDYVYDWYKVKNAAELYEYYMDGMDTESEEMNSAGRPVILVYSDQYYVTYKKWIDDEHHTEDDIIKLGGRKKDNEDSTESQLSMANISNIPELQNYKSQSGNKKKKTEKVAFETLGNVTDLYIHDVAVEEDGKISLKLNDFSLSATFGLEYETHLSQYEIEKITGHTFEDKITIYNDDIPKEEHYDISCKDVSFDSDKLFLVNREDEKLTFAKQLENPFEPYTITYKNWDIKFDKKSGTILTVRDLHEYVRCESKDSDKTTEDPIEYLSFCYRYLSASKKGRFISGSENEDYSDFEVYLGKKVAFPTISEDTTIEDYLLLEGFSGVEEGAVVSINDGAVLVINGTCVNKGLIKLNGGTLIVNGVLYGPSGYQRTDYVNNKETYTKGSIVGARNGTIIINEGGVIAMYSPGQTIGLKYGSFLYNYGVMATECFMLAKSSGHMKSPSAQNGKGYVNATIPTTALSAGIPSDKLISKNSTWGKEAGSYYYVFNKDDASDVAVLR